MLNKEFNEEPTSDTICQIFIDHLKSLYQKWYDELKVTDEEKGNDEQKQTDEPKGTIYEPWSLAERELGRNHENCRTCNIVFEKMMYLLITMAFQYKFMKITQYNNWMKTF